MKVTRKRMNQVKGLAALRKAKISKIKLNKETGRQIIHKNPNIQQFKNLILRKDLKFPCRHYLIGSSSFNRFLKKQFDLKMAHGCLRSQFNQKLGSIGEEAYAKTSQSFIY